MKDLYGSNQIRRLGVARRQKGGATSVKVKRKTGHQREKTGDAPATQNCGANSRRNQAFALSKRQIVHDTLHQGMRAIEVVPGVIAALIDIECQAAIVARLKAHAFAEGVGRGGRQAAREVPVEFHLQSVVAG